MAIGPGAEKTRGLARGQVLRRQRAKGARHVHLSRVGRQLHRPVETRRLGHVHEQVVHTVHPNGGQHGLAVGIGQRQVTHRALVSVGYSRSSTYFL